MKVEVIKSKRKSFSIQVVSSEYIIVRAPYRASKKAVAEVLDKNKAWIEKHLEKRRREEQEAADIRTLSELELSELAERAKIVFKEKVEHFAPIVGVTYGRITIRNQKTRWGSCSSKGNLNFNVALMRAPIEVLDYVVVHELCHRLYLNHSREFWSEVGRVIPDYKSREKWLKENGARIMKEVNGLV